MLKRSAVLVVLAVGMAVLMEAGGVWRPEARKSRKQNPIPQAARNLEVPGVTPAWLDSVGRQLDRFERTIRLRPNEQDAFVAATDSCFATIRAGGMKVVSSSHQDRWQLDWKWCSIRGLKASPPTFTTRGEFMLQVDRGPIREILENREDGLEHVIEVKEKPAAAGSLRVDIAVSGDLSLSPPKEADRLVFADSSGDEVLQYRGLKVWDARGTVLAARFETTSAGFAISVDDAQAQYPVTIDPVFDDLDWVTAGPVAPPGGSSQLGFSVASAGDIDGDGSNDLIVGIPYLAVFGPDSGMVWIFLGSDVGVPDEVADFGFIGPDQPGALFGWSVAGGDFNGDGAGDVLAGAPLFSAVGAPNCGAAFLYLWEGPGFEPGLILPPAGGAYSAGAQRGFSVANAGEVDAIASDDIVVGEPQFDPGAAPGAGQVTCYAMNAFGLFGLPFDVLEGTGAAGENFGWSLVCAGDPNTDGGFDLLIGAPGLDDTGGVYFWFSNALTPGPDYMPGPAAVVTGDAEEGAGFGWSVAGGIDVNGDDVEDALIGAPFAGESDMGAAYIYYGDPFDGLAPEYSWSSSGEESDGANYGYSVAWGDDDNLGPMVIGAPGYEDQTGRAYAYTWTADLINFVVTINEDDPAYETGEDAGDRFGHSLAIFELFDSSGAFGAFVGAPGVEFLPGGTDQGRVSGFFDD